MDEAAGPHLCLGQQLDPGCNPARRKADSLDLCWPSAFDVPQDRRREPDRPCRFAAPIQARLCCPCATPPALKCPCVLPAEVQTHSMCRWLHRVGQRCILHLYTSLGMNSCEHFAEIPKQRPAFVLRAFYLAGWRTRVAAAGRFERCWIIPLHLSDGDFA
jgi:hypothetical protein